MTSPIERKTTSPSTNADSSAPSALQYLAGILILGASAGLTLYTKKTGTMLAQMERASKSKAQRMGPQKYGQKTLKEHDKTRPRMENDELF